ncbi:MAG: DUF4982 domain-containing protein [Clostridia bacterium]|nr:DUF4982 domain-containing protein [Clostridia bacterium]
MREKLNFDRNWKFALGDIEMDYPRTKPPASYSSKTERAQWGPASFSYDTGMYASEHWSDVDLPHDYTIHELPDEKYNEAHGFFPRKNAWYRKTFKLEKSDENKRITLLFDGIATHATVYVNGCLLTRNFCGYTSFEVDMTDVARFGEDNVVAVYVNTQNPEGWWYQGGGIYRHVWLQKTSLFSIDLWGVFAKPVFKGDGEWVVETETTVRNDTLSRRNISLVGEILDKDGKVVAESKISGFIDDKDKRTFKYGFDIKSPDLWSPESPTQYVMKTKVYVKNELVDEYDVKFGFRTIRVDKDTGLFINEKNYKIKGVCAHADFGLSGKAVPDNIQRYKISLLKEMGANGYRTAHYPHAAEVMDELDANGFIVMDETRWFESTPEGKAQLEMLMKRDRNRPSVIFWSIANEEPIHAKVQGKRIAQSLKAFAKKLDDSRPIMAAVNNPDVATIFEDMDIVGMNYRWHLYDKLRAQFPHKPFMASENCATGTTRGQYLCDDERNTYISSYDHDISITYKSREFYWKFITERDWVMGGYQWIAFEHRGEAAWPRLCSQSGAIDLFMQKKDPFYQNQSHWTDEPMVHLLPHWNFKGLEGMPLRVVAYSNMLKLELFLNGKSLGVSEKGRYDHSEWMVPYEAGKLEVVAYDGDKIVARDEKITSSAPARLMLKLETEDICANGEDLALVTCYVVDKDGLEVPDAECTVHFSTNELGKIYTTGSDVTDHTSLFLPTRRMRAGRASATVKLKETEGTLRVFATASGLESAMLSVELHK